MGLTYNQGATLPGTTLTCTERNPAGVDVPVDLSAGYTFRLVVGDPASPAFVKTTGIVGTTSGVSVSWAASGELGTLLPGRYLLTLVATTGGQARKFTTRLDVLPAGA